MDKEIKIKPGVIMSREARKSFKRRFEAMVRKEERDLAKKVAVRMKKK